MARPAGSSNNQLYKWAQKAASLFVSAPVANASLADMTQATIKGRASGAGTGPPTDLTGTQTTAILDVFTSALKGLVPNSGGGTANFLRADGAFAAPPAFTAATQAEQEAGSSLTVGVTPGRQQFHPSAIKAWARWNNSGTLAVAYNVSSITDTGIGDWTVNFATAFSTGNYYVAGAMDTGNPASGSITDLMQNTGAAPTTTACRMLGVSWDAGAAVQSLSDSPGGRAWAGFAGDQ
jgi:hypothetical protein